MMKVYGGYTKKEFKRNYKKFQKVAIFFLNGGNQNHNLIGSR
jgi:hypothetical protein